MTISESVALIMASLSVSGVIFHIGRTAGRFEEIQRDRDRADEEIERLRIWRHKVGEQPSYVWTELAKLLEERMERQEREIEKLRAWHHKIGDNPTERWVMALDVLARRLDRLDKKE